VNGQTCLSCDRPPFLSQRKKKEGGRGENRGRTSKPCRVCGWRHLPVWMEIFVPQIFSSAGGGEKKKKRGDRIPRPRRGSQRGKNHGAAKPPSEPADPNEGGKKSGERGRGNDFNCGRALRVRFFVAQRGAFRHYGRQKKKKGGKKERGGRRRGGRG